MNRSKNDSNFKVDCIKRGLHFDIDLNKYYLSSMQEVFEGIFFFTYI